MSLSQCLLEARPAQPTETDRCERWQSFRRETSLANWDVFGRIKYIIRAACFCFADKYFTGCAILARRWRHSSAY